LVFALQRGWDTVTASLHAFRRKTAARGGRYDTGALRTAESLANREAHHGGACSLPLSGRRRSLQRMLDWTQCSAVERVPGKVSGAWVFKGTRVPVAALFENLEDGATVDQFVEWFPGVSREQALTVLKFAESTLAAAAT
jgi:uncharacterized protein (DUF433 family)